MNIATKQRILSALRHTTATVSAIAEDHGIDQQAVRDMAGEYGIMLKTRANGGPAPRTLVPSAPAIYGSQSDIAALSAAEAGSRALLRRQLEAGQYSGAARHVWLERHGVAA